MWFLLLWILAAPTLVGHVTDSAGKPVTGATVQVLPGGTSIVTDRNGRFRLSTSGRFQIQIGHAGFRTIQSSPIDLAGDGVYQIEVSLLSGDSTQTEHVELRIDDSSAIADREETGAREGLPRADRLFGTRGGINLTGIAEGAGQQWVAASGSVFTSSSMATVVSDTGNVSAELGDTGDPERSLPSGQKTFHGNLHYAGRNDWFNAKNFFDPPNVPIPPFKYHFFGADLGGQIRNGTYFYTQYWGLRIRQSITRAATVPLPAMLNGDFSSLTTEILNPETGFPFPGNKIPKSSFNSIGAALARLYPAPNVPGATQNYRAVARLSTSADSTGLRLDHRLTAADQATLEYQFVRDRTDDPFNLLSGITNLPFFGVRDALQTHALRMSDTHVYSPSLIQEFHVAANSLKQPRSILDSAPLGPAILITGYSNLGYSTNLPQERHSQGYEVSSTVSRLGKKSATRVGATFRYFPFDASIDLYQRGQYQFTGGIFSGNALANLLLGDPTNALRLTGNTSRKFETQTIAFFVQHDWQVVPRLMFNVGLRYDYQRPFRERYGLAGNFNPDTGLVESARSDLYFPDRNNFGPRLGFAWRAPGDVVFRAGYGVFYDTLSVGDSLFFLGLNPPLVRLDLQNNGPVVPQFDLGNAFDNVTPSTPPSIFSASQHLPNPTLQHWDFSLQRSIRRNFVFELSYFGQKGSSLRRQLNLNQPSPGPAGSLDGRRPYAAFQNIFQFEDTATSIAHAAEVRVERRFHSGLGFTGSYRFSKFIDDATLISTLPQDSHNLGAERGLADFDVRHRLLVSINASLPGKWQLQATGTVQSGMPLSAVLGADVAGTGSPIVNRPDLVGNPNDGNHTASQFFNPSAFRIPETGRFGTSGRNVIIGPGLRNVDMAIVRMFRTSDFTRVQFRTDIFNVFNHPDFVAPPSEQNLADSPDFGAMFIARSPRIFQFGLKFLW